MMHSSQIAEFDRVDEVVVRNSYLEVISEIGMLMPLDKIFVPDDTPKCHGKKPG